MIASTLKTKYATLTGLTALTIVLASCGANPLPANKQAAELMGGATPAASPQSAQPAGKIVPLGPIADIEATAKGFAVRVEDKLLVGSSQSFEAGTAFAIDLNPECKDVTATDSEFLVACGDMVMVIPEDEPGNTGNIETQEDFPVTSAAKLSTGEIFVASDSQARVSVYKEGKRVDSFSVAAPTDQLIAVYNQENPDNVVRTWNEDTTIQSLDWINSREGGRLRVGKGLGTISAGNDGVIVASDALGHRVAIYTAQDVVRLHQFGNTEGTPWATSWDEKNQLAWVTTTDNNLVHGYEISAGVPQEVKSLATIADAHSLAVNSAGTMLIGSAKGDGLQIIEKTAS